MLLNSLKGELKASGELHPALLRWLCDRLGERPDIASALVFAMVIMVWHLERPMVDPNGAYDRYMLGFAYASNVAQQEGHSIDHLGQPEFDEAFASMADDIQIASVLGREPLIVEHGPVGRIRRELWSAGLREPEVTLNMFRLGVLRDEALD